MKQTGQHINVWEDCLSIIRDNIPEESFKTWFEPIEALSLEGSTLSIKVPSDFFREYIEEHYIDLIGKTLKRVMGKFGFMQIRDIFSKIQISVGRNELSEEDYDFYLDLRKYGSARHAGFGLGFERCVMYLTGMSNIRDVIPFPRTVNNCEL